MSRVVLLASLIMVVLVAYGCSDEPLTMEDSTTAALAPGNPGSPADPHDGGCTAYCARAWLPNWVGTETGIVGDFNNDGKIQSCLVETQCNRPGAVGCPADGDVCERDPDDPLYCELVHGPDTH